VLPHFLVKGIKEALQESKAVKIYVCNVMTQPGETDNFKASDHIRVLLNYLSPVKIDYALINVKLPEKEEALDKYADQGAFPVDPDIKAIEKMGVNIVPLGIISEDPFLRHDPTALAETLLKVILKATGKIGTQKIGNEKISS